MKTEPIQFVSEDQHGQRFSHPAFGVIRLGRVSGRRNLTGSDFATHNFIEITISRADLHRGLSNDRYYAKEELITVALTEAQLATFLTSAGSGSGTPCTLTDINREFVPELPTPDPIVNRFKADVEKTMGELQAKLKSVAKSLSGDKPPTKKQARELANALDLLSHRLVSSTTFVAEQFEQHAERVIEDMKTEVNGHIQAVAPQLKIGDR